MEDQNRVLEKVEPATLESPNGARMFKENASIRSIERGLLEAEGEEEELGEDTPPSDRRCRKSPTTRGRVSNGVNNGIKCTCTCLHCLVRDTCTGEDHMLCVCVLWKPRMK